MIIRILLAIGVFAGAIAISNENTAAAIVAAGAFIGLGLSQVESLRIKKE